MSEHRGRERLRQVGEDGEPLGRDRDGGLNTLTQLANKYVLATSYKSVELANCLRLGLETGSAYTLTTLISIVKTKNPQSPKTPYQTLQKIKR
jgi:predicted HAD superfamily phosphohydrolase